MFSGQISLPSNSDNKFFIVTTKDTLGEFLIGGKPVQEFKKLNISISEQGTSLSCLTAIYNQSLSALQVMPTDCNQNFGIICRKILIPKTTCNATSTFQKKNTFDLIFDPSLISELQIAVAKKKKEYKDILLRIDLKRAYEGLFSLLYSANLPCFDTKGITAEKDGDRGNLKYCEWKGKPMSCSAIFSTFPSDQGLCCSFNMKAAEDIFWGNKYPKIVNNLQDFDKNHSFSDSQVPIKYLIDNEPKSLPGRNKGLVVVLDAHRDLLSAGSMDIDLFGFLGFIGTNQTYPRLNLEGFEIMAGHRNIITLTATKLGPGQLLGKILGTVNSNNQVLILITL